MLESNSFPPQRIFIFLMKSEPDYDNFITSILSQLHVCCQQPCVQRLKKIFVSQSSCAVNNIPAEISSSKNE